MIVGVLLAGLTLVLHQAPDAQCYTVDEMVRYLGWNVPTKLPKNHAADLLKQADVLLAQCPDSEGTWYGVLRAHELESQEHQAPRTLAATARQRFPGSVRIATVYARAVGTLDAAQEAVRLDPRYAPAQVAYASALLAAGKPEQARVVLEAVSDLKHVSGGPTLLAKALLATGHPNETLKASKDEPVSELGLIEPISGHPGALAESVEISGMAYLAKRDFDQAARRLLTAAALGHIRAREMLETADGALLQALIRLSKARLPTDEKAVLSESLKHRQH